MTGRIRFLWAALFAVTATAAYFLAVGAVELRHRDGGNGDQEQCNCSAAQTHDCVPFFGCAKRPSIGHG